MDPVHHPKVTRINSAYIEQQQMVQEKKQRKLRILFRRLTAIGICAMLLGIATFTTLQSQSSKMDQLAKEKMELEAKMAELVKEEERLRADIKKLNNDEYIAKIARSEYFLSEEGEVIFKIVE